MSNYQTPTAETYAALDRAFNFFNGELFDHRLPACMITLQRKRGARGYFWAEQFKHREDGDRSHEIALNPESMGRTIPEVLSTLVHEMTHLEQQEYGQPGKGGFHNREWVGLMERIGLIPTATGEIGGAQTGRKVTHVIDEGGAFDVSCQKLMATGFALPWFTEAAERGAASAKKKDLSKVKHECPACQAKAWAKIGSNLMCGDCDEHMVAEE